MLVTVLIKYTRNNINFRRADHSHRGVLTSVVYRSRIIKPRQWGSLDPLRGCRAMGKKTVLIRYMLYGEVWNEETQPGDSTSKHSDFIQVLIITRITTSVLTCLWECRLVSIHVNIVLTQSLRDLIFAVLTFFWGTWWRSCWRHCATSRKVAGSIPVGIIHWHNPSGRTMALGLTQLLTEMSTSNISWKVKAAGA